ncbi:MAG: hypothetical protein ABJA81_01100, partial [Nocardioidaceae bacterium]
MFRFTSRSKLCSVAAVAASLLLTATGAVTARAAAPLAVSATPVSYTPWLLSTTPDQFVYEIDQCGGLMYSVGRVSSIGQGSQTYTRGNAFSFSATNGTMTSWNPQANAPIRSIAFSPDCSIAYLGGSFTSIKGVSANGIAAVDTSTGALIQSFAHNASGEVNVVELVNGNLIAGGTFTAINGAQRMRLASLDPTTGVPTSYLTLQAAGGKVYNSQVSHSGDKLLIEGNFSTVGGVTRHQIAMLDLGASSATLNNWYSNEFSQVCAISFYVRDAAWSPDDQSIYVATTGAWPANGGQGGPRSGLCDAAAKFPATAQTVSHSWINYTGCDSLYAVEATSDTVYIAGHEGLLICGKGESYRTSAGTQTPR